MTEFTPEPQESMSYPDLPKVRSSAQPTLASPFATSPQPMSVQPLLAQPMTPQSGAPVGLAVEETGVTRSWLLAAGAALVVGAISALAYAAISFAIQREFLMLVIGVGLLVGLSVAAIAKRKGVVTGVVAALITSVAVLVADVLMVVFFAAGSIPKGLSRLPDVDLGTAISAYFSDPLGYLWLGVALLAAFSTASGIGGKRAS